MLIRLLPEQVNNAWDALAPLIAESLPPTIVASYPVMVDVLEAVMGNRAVAWVYYDQEEKPAAFILTTVYKDPITRAKHVLIYALCGIRDLSPMIWEDGIRTLKEYARSIEAVSILAYTNQPGMVRMVQRAGGKAEYTLLEV